MGGSGEKWKKSKPSKYSVDADGKMVRKGTECPNCGPGVFMGEHSDRKVCGKCGHSIAKPPETDDSQ